MKITIQAEMELKGIKGPKEPGYPPVATLAFKAAVNEEMAGTLAAMMRAPDVTVTIEQLQIALPPTVDPSTGEILS